MLTRSAYVIVRHKKMRITWTCRKPKPSEIQDKKLAKPNKKFRIRDPKINCKFYSAHYQSTFTVMRYRNMYTELISNLCLPTTWFFNFAVQIFARKYRHYWKTSNLKRLRTVYCVVFDIPLYRNPSRFTRNSRNSILATLKTQISNNTEQSREQTESKVRENIHVWRWNLHVCSFFRLCALLALFSLSHFIDRHYFCCCGSARSFFCYEREAKKKIHNNQHVYSATSQRGRWACEKCARMPFSAQHFRNSNCFIIELDRLIAQIVREFARTFSAVKVISGWFIITNQVDLDNFFYLRWQFFKLDLKV